MKIVGHVFRLSAFLLNGLVAVGFLICAYSPYISPVHCGIILSHFPGLECGFLCVLVTGQKTLCLVPALCLSVRLGSVDHLPAVAVHKGR